jgi:hypothetical protein
LAIKTNVKMSSNDVVGKSRIDSFDKEGALNGPEGCGELCVP